MGGEHHATGLARRCRQSRSGNVARSAAIALVDLYGYGWMLTTAIALVAASVPSGIARRRVSETREIRDYLFST